MFSAFWWHHSFLYATHSFLDNLFCGFSWNSLSTKIEVCGFLNRFFQHAKKYTSNQYFCLICYLLSKKSFIYRLLCKKEWNSDQKYRQVLLKTKVFRRKILYLQFCRMSDKKTFAGYPVNQYPVCSIITCIYKVFLYFC